MGFENYFGRHMAIRFWMLSIAATALIMMSLDLNRQSPRYEISVTPIPEYRGDVRIVFYGTRFDDSISNGALQIPSKGWQSLRGVDSVTLVASGLVLPVRIVSTSQPVHFGFAYFSGGGALMLDNGAGFKREIRLAAAEESIPPLVLGGETSIAPPTRYGPVYDLFTRLIASACVFLVTCAVAFRVVGKHKAVLSESVSPRNWEILALSLPLFLSTGLVLMAFYPGNVSYDGSQQWVQAAIRGELYAPIGYPTTYLMRLFTLASASPISLIVVQSLFAALSVSLVLRELRHRGVSLLVVFSAVFVIAVTPQYATFFTGLGKDALGAIGLLCLTWTLLAIARSWDTAPSVGILFCLVCSSVFSALMRSNAMPVVLACSICAFALLYKRHRRLSLIFSAFLCLLLTLGLPRIFDSLANQENLYYAKTSKLENLLSGVSLPLGAPGLPLGGFLNLYMYHLFGSAVVLDVPLADEDARLFYKIAPRSAWAKYDCSMTDVTIVSIHKELLMKPSPYALYLHQNQRNMAAAIGRIILQSPGVLFARQACITRIIWYIGVGQKPFQTTATLGYDSVDSRFIALAGDSSTFLPSLRERLRDYQAWSESPKWFWLFWKPALPFALCMLATCLMIYKTRDRGLFFGALIPIVSLGVLFLVIPFPAYRYLYPSVLLIGLLSLSMFGRRPST